MYNSGCVHKSIVLREIQINDCRICVYSEKQAVLFCNFVESWMNILIFLVSSCHILKLSCVMQNNLGCISNIYDTICFFFHTGVKVIFRVALVLLKQVVGTPQQQAESEGLYEIMEKLKNIPPHLMDDEVIYDDVSQQRDLLSRVTGVLWYIFPNLLMWVNSSDKGIGGKDIWEGKWCNYWNSL